MSYGKDQGNLNIFISELEHWQTDWPKLETLFNYVGNLKETVKNTHNVISFGAVCP